MLCTDTPCFAVERVGMPEIVHMWVDYARARIGLDQYQAALAGLPEGSSVGLTALRDTDMAAGHAWIDAIGIPPVGGDIALPVSGFEFNCPQSPRHSTCSGGRFRMFPSGNIRQHQHGDADRHDDPKEPLGGI
jgi:hypothetical protein